MLSFRPATEDDAIRLWVWRNDAAALAASVSSEPVPLADHLAWLRRTLEHPDVRLYVVRDTARDVYAGSVRYDIAGAHGNVATVSLVVDPQQRGRGYAGLILDEVLRMAAADGADVAHAVIHPGNAPSLRAFWRAGFRPAELTDSERPVPPFVAWRRRLREESDDAGDARRADDGRGNSAGVATERPGTASRPVRPARKARR